MVCLDKKTIPCILPAFLHFLCEIVAAPVPSDDASAVHFVKSDDCEQSAELA